MFEALRALQIVAWVGVVGVALFAARRLCDGAIDGVALVRRLRGVPREEIAIALDRAPRPLTGLAGGARAQDPNEALVLLSEQTLAAERWCTRGLPWIRILGVAASAIAFVAVAHQISWLHEDHGLLDLDPARVGRIASERAATALALGVAASGSAVALGALVRERARRALAAVAALRDLLERQLERRAQG